MTTDAPAPAPTTSADAAGTGTLPALSRVLRLVRKLIDYGKQLVATVQQGAAAPGFAHFARPFGTADVAVILARITSGLRRAAALEARLCRYAARGTDLAIAPICLPALPGSGTARKAAPPDACADPAEDPRLSRLPTEEEIAREVQRRPIGAVIVDICADLGIAPGHLDRAFWDQISEAIILYGGSLVRFHNTLHDRLSAMWRGDGAGPPAPEPPASPPRLPAAATGPP